MAKAMQASGFHWTAEMPNEWSIDRLKSATRITLGKMLCPEPAGSNTIYLPYVRAANLSERSSIAYENLKKMWFSPAESKTLALRSCDILITEGGTIGQPMYVEYVQGDGPICFQNSINRLRSQENQRFVFYWMRFLFDSGYHLNSINTVSIAHLTKEKLGEVPIFLPSRKEQRRIADWLDLQTTRIDKRRELLAKKRELLSELRKSIIHESVTGKIDLSTAGLPSLEPIVARPMKESGVNWIGELPATWELKRFKNAGSFQTGKDHKSLSAGSVPVFGSSSEPFAWVDRPLCSRKAIAIGRKGTIDRPFVIQPGFWAVDTCMFHTVLRTDFSLEYLGYWSNIVPWKEISTQTALPSLTQTDANNVIAAYPPVDEQHCIANFLDQRLSKIARQITLIDQLDDLLKQQRKSLIHEAVTGKIDLSCLASG